MTPKRDHRSHQVALDTNRRSCSDGGVTNTRSFVDGTRGQSRASAASTVRQAGRVHRRPPVARWRPVGADPGTGSAAAPVLRCPADDGTGPSAQGGNGSRHPAVAARRQALRVRRRRLVLAVCAGGILVALALPWGGAGSHPLAALGSVSAGATLSPHSLYVVQPGDTLWSIAERLDPTADPRPVVAELEAQIGSDVVQPGEHLRLP